MLQRAPFLLSVTVYQIAIQTLYALQMQMTEPVSRRFAHSRTCVVSSWLKEFHREQAKLADQRNDDSDPLLPALALAVAGFNAISTTALLTMLNMAVTTGAARRIAPLMYRLGFAPIVSRTLPPGGVRSSVCRGWARSPLPKRRPASATDQQSSSPSPIAAAHDRAAALELPQ